jgi:PEP-CTERM motif-containing protein
MGKQQSIARGGLLTSVAAAAVLLGAPAKADSLAPSSFSATIGVGGVTDITDKLGVISAGSPTTALADVMFIVDTTGSMSGGIADVNAALSSTVSALSAFGTISTGAAEYKDKTNAGDPFDYQLDQAITANSALTQAALSGLSASGGGDTPEQGLFALSSATTDPATGWEAGAKKIEVIVGDAPSHDDVHPTAAGGVTVSGVAATLSSNGVTLITLDANPVTHGDGGIDAYGQFSGLLADGVSGPPVAGFTNSTDITNAIVAAVGTAFATYSTVSLGLVGPAPSDCSVSLPGSFSGSFDRSVDRSFSFGTVGVTGVSAGVCSFNIGLFADGVLLATESDRIAVTGTVPEPATWATMLIGFAALGYMGYRKRAKVALSA